MKNNIKVALLALALGVGLVAPLAITQTAHAANNSIQDACSSSDSASSLCQDSKGRSATGVIDTVVNVLLFIVGIISVVMIIVGGIRFATSGGNAGSVTSAKNTVLYAVVGLVLAFIAYAIVTWVLDLF